MCSMKKLKCIFIICILCCAVGCSCPSRFVTDCGYEEIYNYENTPYYINKSGTPVKIYMRWFNFYNHVSNYSYGYVQNEDTLHKPFTFFGEFTTVNLIEVQFLENTTNCLIYSDTIQDSLTDMRSLEAYERGDTISGTYFISYFYTITPEHKAMAKEEYCQAPYWME